MGEKNAEYWKELAETRQKELEELVDMSNELESALEGELASVQAENERLLSMMEEKNAEIERAKSAIKEAKASVDKGFDTSSHLEEKIAALESTKQRLEIENEELSNQVRIIQASMDDLRHQLDGTLEQIVFLQQEKEEHEESTRRLHERISDLETDRFAVQQQQETQANSEQLRRGAEKEEEINKLRSENDDLQKTVVTLRMEVTDAQTAHGKVKSLEEDLSRIRLEREELRAVAADAQTTSGKVKSLEEDLSRIRREREELRAAVEHKRSEIHTLRKQFELLQADKSIQDVESKYEGALSKIDRLEMDRDQLQREVDRLSEIAETPSRLESELSVKAEELQIAHYQLNLTKEENSKLMGQVAQLENDLRIVKQEIDEIKASGAKSKRLLEELEEERTKVHSLSNLLEEERRKFRELESSSRQGGGLPDDVMQLRLAYSAQLRTNAALLARMQKMRGNILVCCRIRPKLGKERNDPQVAVESLSSEEISFFNEKANNWRPFAFDRVFGSHAAQVEVSRELSDLGIAESVLGGTNACIMAYGQTGSGKTFTMDGPVDDPGINVMTIRRIYELRNLLENSSQGKYTIRLAMVEIYNEEIRDLLATCPDAVQVHGEQNDISETASVTSDVTVATTRSVSRKGLTVSGSASTTSHTQRVNKSRIGIGGFSFVRCDTLGKVEATLSTGRSQRSTAATNLNLHSSRSHLIIMLEVKSTQAVDPSSSSSSTDPEGLLAQIGTLFLVDLAGSERVSKSGVEGSRLDETKHINRSLSALGDVMEALDSKDRNRHIPYRNSKLTHLLQPVLGGNSRTVMILTVPPTLSSAQETLFSLQFASRARNIELGAAKKQVQVKNTAKELQGLREQLSETQAMKTKAEARISELKRKLHLAEQSMAAVKTEGTKKEDAQKKRVEHQAAASAKELFELRNKHQHSKDIINGLREELETEKRKAKADLKNLTQAKVSADRRVIELSTQLELQRSELLRVRAITEGGYSSPTARRNSRRSSISSSQPVSTTPRSVSSESSSFPFSPTGGFEKENHSNIKPLSSPFVLGSPPPYPSSTNGAQEGSSASRIVKPSPSRIGAPSSVTSTSSHQSKSFKSKIPRPSTGSSTSGMSSR